MQAWFGNHCTTPYITIIVNTTGVQSALVLATMSIGFVAEFRKE